MTYRTFDGTSQSETITDGRFSSDGTQFLKDSENVNIGTDGDLKIYHDGSHSFIQDTGTGRLKLSASAVQITNAAVSKTMLYAVEDGAVELYYDHDKKLETYSSGVQVTGTLFIPDGGSASNRISIGNSGDLKIYHNGTNNYLDSTNGHIYLRVNSTENAIKCTHDGNVEISYDGTKKLETTTDGVEITGTLVFDSSISGGTIKLADDQKVFLGGGDDLKIYHDGSNSYIDDLSGTGALIIRTNQLFLKNNDGDENYLLANSGSSVELYFDNEKKFETISTGIKVSGADTGDQIQIVASGTNANGVIDFESPGTGGGIIKTQGTTALTLDNSQNATFAGDIAISKLKKLSMRDSGTQRAYIELDSGDDVVYWGHGDTDTNHIFYADAGKILTIQSDGIAVESGKGINFSAVGTGGGSTSSLLDDYEEGTWTPQFSAGFSAAAQTHGTDGALTVGSYTKIGNLVNVSFIIRLADDTAGGHPSTSNGARINISGLPFTSASTSYHYGVGSTAYHHFAGSSDATAPASILIGTGGTVLDFYQGNTSFIGGNGSDQKAKTLYGMATYHTT